MEIMMAELDPRLFDKDSNREAMTDAFSRESSERYNGIWSDSNTDRFMPDIKDLPRLGSTPDMLPLLEDYYKVLDTGDYDLLENLFEKGFPINFVSPYTGAPTLHALAATCSRMALKVLHAQPGVDYLLRDRSGRLASECAFLFSGDPELAQIISEKEKEQADRQEVKLTRRPAPQP
jgi:hypothetical protein